MLVGFFGDDAAETLDAIEALIPQVAADDQAFVIGIVKSARAGLAKVGATKSE